MIEPKKVKKRWCKINKDKKFLKPLQNAEIDVCTQGDAEQRATERYGIAVTCNCMYPVWHSLDVNKESKRGKNSKKCESDIQCMHDRLS
jgi:hypothetical protein